MKLRKLETELKIGKILLTQVKREGDIAIYTEKDFKGNYEVIVIKQSPPHFLSHDTSYDMIELYPGNSVWGKLGFTYSSLESAEKKFDELINQKKDK